MIYLIFVICDLLIAYIKLHQFLSRLDWPLFRPAAALNHDCLYHLFATTYILDTAVAQPKNVPNQSGLQNGSINKIIFEYSDNASTVYP